MLKEEILADSTKNQAEATTSSPRTPIPQTRRSSKRSYQASEPPSDEFDESSNESSKDSTLLSTTKRRAKGRPPLSTTERKNQRVAEQKTRHRTDKEDVETFAYPLEPRKNRRKPDEEKLRPGRKSMEELRDKYCNRLMDIWNAAKDIKVGN